MKFTFFIALNVLIFTGSFSQEDSLPIRKFHWGASSAAGFDKTLNELHLTNSLTYSNTKNLFSLGHIFLNKTQLRKKCGGIEFNYQYYPNKNDRKLNLFFYNRTCFIWDAYQRNFEGNIYRNNQIYKDKFEYNMEEKYLQTFIGYGLRCNFSKRFYIFQNNGIGILIYGRKETYTYEQHPEFDETHEIPLRSGVLDIVFTVAGGLGVVF